MDQTLTCPVCGYDNEWDGSRARTVQCKRCETELRTPGKNSVVRVADRPEAAPPEAKPRSAIWKIVIFSLVGLKIAAIAGKIIFDLNKGPNKPPQEVPAQIQAPGKAVPQGARPVNIKGVPAFQPSFQLSKLSIRPAVQPGDLGLRVQFRRVPAPPIMDRIILVIKVGEDHFSMNVPQHLLAQPITAYLFDLPAAFVPAGKHEVTVWMETVANDAGLPARRLSNEVRTMME